MADASKASVLDRFAAYGFNVIRLEDGHDLNAIADALAQAQANTNGKPTFIECKTLIGKGIPEVAGTAAGHGEEELSLPSRHVRDWACPRKILCIR